MENIQNSNINKESLSVSLSHDPGSCEPFYL